MTKQELKRLLGYLKSEPDYTLKLFLITRHYKEGMRYLKKVDKYQYKASVVDINSEIKEYFYSLLVSKLNYKLSDDDVTIQEYQIISDDLDNKIFTYEINPDLDFSGVILNQLNEGTNIPNVESLEDVENNLWTYCVKIDFIHEPRNILFFRKMNRGKIATAEKDFIKKLKCKFNTRDTHLEVLDEDVINFDDKIDCLYIDNSFYILRKKSFENILGLENEYKANASEVIEDLISNDVIEGMDIFEEKVMAGKMLLKKLANIARSRNHKNIDSQRLSNMKRIVQRLNLDLQFTEDDKILVNNDNDVEVVVKMLDKYYLECMQTQEPYGAFAKESLAED